MKTSPVRHLGQSISLALVLVLMSVAVILLMTIESARF